MHEKLTSGSYGLQTQPNESTPPNLNFEPVSFPSYCFSACGAGEPTHCVSLWYRLPAHVNKAACAANPSRCWLLSQRVTVCQSTSPGAHDKERMFACLPMLKHTRFAQGELKKQQQQQQQHILQSSESHPCREDPGKYTALILFCPGCFEFDHFFFSTCLLWITLMKCKEKGEKLE